MDSTFVNIVGLVQHMSWLSIAGVVIIILGVFVKNNKLYAWGWQLGTKLSLIKAISPIAHLIAQATGWVASVARGFGDGLDGKPKAE